MVDIKSLNDKKVNLDQTSAYERYRWRIIELVNNFEILTDWEKGFIKSLKSKLDSGNLGEISRNQRMKLLQIWSDKMAEGKVKLPKGKF